MEIVDRYNHSTVGSIKLISCKELTPLTGKFEKGYTYKPTHVTHGGKLCSTGRHVLFKCVLSDFKYIADADIQSSEIQICCK
jgi:hypothetical protein